MGENEIIAVVRKYKKRILTHFKDADVYLYGSRSKGNAKPESDIDIAVVVPKVEGDFMEASALLWALTWDVNAPIEPVLLEKQHPSPLYEDVLNTGQLV